MKKSIYIFLLSVISLYKVSDAQMVINVDTFPVINTMMGQVDTVLLVDNIRHLQDYGTRYCMSTQALQAQQWIKDQYTSYGLNAVFQDFTSWGGQNPSDNVIATLPGSVTTDEFVVIGGHYDSYSFSGDAPGADDNASGTCGVLEIARILSQYTFEKTLVFCAFSGEEVGLFGSEAYAAEAEGQGMNILGYFNLDMIGYRHGNDTIHTNLDAGSGAQPLVDFFIDVCDIFLPDFVVEYPCNLPGGSDHYSFGEHGFMGIFAFEDEEFYSPYIHSDADTIGTSFNSALMARTFIQANMAAAATLARPVTSTGINVPCEDNIGWTVYPNPATSMVSLATNTSETCHVQILNVSGAVVYEGKCTRYLNIDASSLSKGIYFVRLIGDRLSETRKLIIK